jgi:outer membrane receptor protein involved in Fe transport
MRPPLPWVPCAAALAVPVLLLACASGAAAQTPAPDTASQTEPAPIETRITVTVIAPTPLPGLELPVSQVPAPVQAAGAQEIAASGALEVSDFLNRRFGSVYVNEVQGNPFQPDLNYRGYTASPLLGTPQGISVYMDGVRLNQPFGDVVSWDLIPRMAISTAALMPGSNPLFGLNTLGGALSVQTKDGRMFNGTTVQATYGSDVRRALEIEHGGRSRSSRIDWYLAGTVFGEDGWRVDSPSDVRQVFGKLGWRGARADVSLSAGYADNNLYGNGLQEIRLLDRDYESLYTKPDITNNRSTLINISGQRRWRPDLTLRGNAYYREIRTDTLNGDINEDSLDQSIYQPGAAERAALAAAGYGIVPASGLDAANTPFPSLRCIANVLLRDEPAEKCNGLLNRSATNQHHAGLSAQVTHRKAMTAGANLFTLGAAFESSHASFTQSSELGYLNPDRSITGLGAFADGVSGGNVDGEPFDARVDLDGKTRTWSAFATDTLPLGARAHLTVSGRFNRTTIRNQDWIRPDGGPASLNGDHVFSRFNPAAGVTIQVSASVGAYAGYNEGSRAATSIELGCANPEQPCKLPNAMAGDPPLEQVVTRTVESGLRGTRGGVSWHAGGFFAENRNDILFVMSDQTGFGYFRNFGQTHRQGVELGARAQAGRVVMGGEYTFLRATFESEERVNGESNSSNHAAEDGLPGVEGEIAIRPGDRLPLVPRHLLKVYADLDVTSRLALDVNVLASGGVTARGNENDRHEPDGVYYLGEGATGAYAVVNLGARFKLTGRFDLVAQVNNLFDRRFATAAQLGPAGFTADGRVQARPLPAAGGEFPLVHSTFVAPGAPLRGWFGARVRF